MVEDEDFSGLATIQNLSFNHPLSEGEIEELKKISLFLNNLRTIYFNEGIDFNSIEVIKHIVEFCCGRDDRLIEKYIVRRNSSSEVKNILDMNYQNPDTWQVAYKSTYNNYTLTTLPKYRKLEGFLNRIANDARKDTCSLVEQIMKVYDRVKLLEYDESSSSDLPTIAETKKTNSLGFNLIFKEVLSKLNVKSYVGAMNGNATSYITLLNIADSKYNLSGIYFFDPSSDSLPKEKYFNDGIRKLGYNFFLLTIKDICSLRSEDKLDGVLSIISVEDYQMALDKMQMFKIKSGNILVNNFFDSLNMSFEDIHHNLFNANRLNIDNMIEIVEKVHAKDYYGNINVDNIFDIIKENYESKRKELFKLEESIIDKDDLEDEF